MLVSRNSCWNGSQTANTIKFKAKYWVGLHYRPCLDIVEFTSIHRVDWGGISFKFHSNPPQYMWIDVNLTTSKQGHRWKYEEVWYGYMSESLDSFPHAYGHLARTTSNGGWRQTIRPSPRWAFWGPSGHLVIRWSVRVSIHDMCSPQSPSWLGELDRGEKVNHTIMALIQGFRQLLCLILNRSPS